MRRTLLVCVLVLLLLAVASRAWAWGDKGPPIIIDAGISYRFNIYVNDGCNGAPKAPWYMYWPCDAAQQAKAGVNVYPNWPAQTQPPGFGTLPPPAHLPPPAPAKKPAEDKVPTAVPGSPAPGSTPVMGLAAPGRLTPPVQVAPLQRTAFQPAGATFQTAPAYWYAR